MFSTDEINEPFCSWVLADYDTNHFIRLINDFGVDHQVAKVRHLCNCLMRPGQNFGLCIVVSITNCSSVGGIHDFKYDSTTVRRLFGK